MNLSFKACVLGTPVFDTSCCRKFRLVKITLGSHDPELCGRITRTADLRRDGVIAVPGNMAQRAAHAYGSNPELQ